MITKLGIIAASASVPVGTFAGASLFAQGTITEHTLMPLGIVVACTVFIVAGTWKAAKAFLQMTGGLKALQDQVTEIKVEVKEMDRRVIHIEKFCPDCNDKLESHKKHA